MCFDFDARPPDLPSDLLPAPVAGGAAAELATLPCPDGAELAVALAPVDGPAPAVVILPDVRGLYPFYVELAERFAASGHHGVAIDYFGRTAGAAPRGEEFDFGAHLGAVTPAQIQADVAVARDALAERAELTAVVTVGFCYGGASSFLAATDADLALDGAVGFYGTLDPDRRVGAPFPMPAPLPVADRTRCPVLGLFGGADDLIPAEDVEAFERALERAGVEHEIVSYPGAPHSFFDRSQAEHAEASADAWRRMIGFVDRVAA